MRGFHGNYSGPLICWIKRLLECLDARGSKSDWLFQQEDGSRKTMKDFEERFYDELTAIQQDHPNAIGRASVDMHYRQPLAGF